MLLPVGALFRLVAQSRAGLPNEPNIVIVPRGLGNAGLGYRGSRIKTPGIDALAKSGVRLESYYGAAA